ncbi:MAG: thioredoxin family protein [Bacillota bacterium]
MSPPALVIRGEVVVTGRVPTREEISRLLSSG